MEKTINIKGEEIRYILKIRKGIKSIRITIGNGGIVKVSAPRFIPEFIINNFIKDKSEWIIKKSDYFSKIPIVKKRSKREEREEYLKYKDNAYSIAKERLVYFNQFYNYKWEKITIRNQKTRWGSCSRKGNLNFNYKIALLSTESIDYIIVHELCHLCEFNHSKSFWKLIEKTIPDYKSFKNQLRNMV